MLYLVGIGLKPKHITLEALEVLKACPIVIWEEYTSKLAEGRCEDLENIVGKRFKRATRRELEELSAEILEDAKHHDVAVAVIGSPTFATTHIQLLIDAQTAGVKTSVVPGISIRDIVGITGLSEYRFGMVVSIPCWKKDFMPESFYDNIVRNYKNNLHTLCLLDVEREMTPSKAAEQILSLENKRARKLLTDATAIVLCRAGGRNQSIDLCTVKELTLKSYDMPCAIIICAKELNFKEREAMEAFGLVKN
jgi:diphthine synthase